MSALESHSEVLVVVVMASSAHLRHQVNTEATEVEVQLVVGRCIRLLLLLQLLLVQFLVSSVAKDLVDDRNQNPCLLMKMIPLQFVWLDLDSVDP